MMELFVRCFIMVLLVLVFDFGLFWNWGFMGYWVKNFVIVGDFFC